MDILLRRDFAFTAQDVRRNVLLPFTADKNYERLALRLHYAPKAVSDPAIIRPQIEQCVRRYFPAGYELTETDMTEYRQLFNFVTLSLDYNGTYVGCAHRHPPEQTLSISARGSSWGFLPLAANAGDWRAVLHVQAVVAGTVDYHLVICGMEGGEDDAMLPSL